METIPQKSRAAVITAFKKPYEVVAIPIPEVEPGGILVRVEMAGVCGTDVHQQQGDVGLKPGFPIMPGHEVVGRIVRLGEGRQTDCAGEPVTIGDRIMWPHVSCGRCYSCTILGQPNLCERRISYGFGSSNDYPYLSGSFAEYEYVVPQADIVKIPAELSNEEVIGACCAFRTAVAAYERMGALGVQSSVVIQGCGPVGLYSTVLFAEGGASQTIVVGAPTLRLDLARRWGADHVINIEELPDPARRLDEIRKLTGGRGPDLVVEASGVPVAFREGMEMIRRGGKYLIVGQTSMMEQAVVPALITLKHLEILGNASASTRHYYKAIQFIKNKRHKYPLGAIVTNRYRLDQVNEAVAAMAAGKEIKPVIIP